MAIPCPAPSSGRRIACIWSTISRPDYDRLARQDGLARGRARLFRPAEGPRGRHRGLPRPRTGVPRALSPPAPPGPVARRSPLLRRAVSCGKCPGRARHRPMSDRITAVTMMRDEAPALLEWVAFQDAIGFDRIVVYTNDCRDGTDAMLDRLARSARRSSAGTIPRPPTRSPSPRRCARRRRTSRFWKPTG
jgi:hypothetical protein